MSTDALGDRMKQYEGVETDRRALPGLPIVVRVDGRGFSKFTAGMARPYDQAMADVMVDTTRYLVEQTNALVGYTQSDEITLLLEAPEGDPTRASELFFGGRTQKIVSVCAGLATARFLTQALQLWPDRCAKSLPVFDARVFSVPSRMEAVNALLWREWDATKNAVTMAARTWFTHQELHGKTGPQKQEMMFQKAGVNFNDYPPRFKRGVYLRRESFEAELSAEQMAHIPEGRRPTGPVIRSEVRVMDWAPLGKMANRVAVVFERAEPALMADRVAVTTPESTSAVRRPKI